MPFAVMMFIGFVRTISREERGFSWPSYWKVDVCPKLELFHDFKADFPVGQGQLRMEWSEGSLKIQSSIGGGRLRYDNQVIELEMGKEYRFL